MFYCFVRELARYKQYSANYLTNASKCNHTSSRVYINESSIKPLSMDITPH